MAMNRQTEEKQEEIIHLNAALGTSKNDLLDSQQNNAKTVDSLNAAQSNLKALQHDLDTTSNKLHSVQDELLKSQDANSSLIENHSRQM